VRVLKFLPVVVALLATLPVFGGGNTGGVPAAFAQSPDGAGSLTLLHNNDGETSLLPLTYGVASGGSTVNLPIGGVASFAAVTARESAEAAAAGNAIVNVYAGDAFLASAALTCSQIEGNPVFDALAQSRIPYTAHILGNHEFDYSPDFLKQFIDAFGGTQPFLSANLSFTGEPSYSGIVDADGLIDVQVNGGRVVGRSMLHVDPETGQRFGIVGATTWTLRTISSPRNVTITSTDLVTTAAAAQVEIDRLLSRGVTKIIFVSHLQDIDNDKALVALLSDVDIAVAGGGDELLANSESELLPGELAPIEGTYPLEVTDVDGRTVYLVTTAGNYKYLGRIDAVFDDEGEIESIVAEETFPRRVIPTSAEATSLGLTDTVTPNAAINASVVEPVEECLEELGTTAVATSEVVLDVSRNTVRGVESNAGNSITDAFVAAYDRYAAGLGLPARSASNPVIAVQNGGGIRQNAGDQLPRGGTAPGPITLLDTIDVMPFGNFVTIVSNVTPADLKTIFERSGASLPGQGGQFLQVSGIRVTYDLNQPAGSRVRTLTLEAGTPIVANGAVVAGAPTVRIVTNNFTAGGGDDYPTFANNPNQLNLPLTYDLAWREYLDGTTIDNADPRYAPGGQGRITIIAATATPTPSPTVAPPTATPTPPAATATATPTRNVPAPPNTGTGPSDGSGSPIELSHVGALVALVAGAFTVLSLRRRS